ncbi:hypothetical protein [Leptospira santarosai]|uniref:Uncharacterized protein n=2 Tax=Leptospira santarosai TaxID=28183 RepID=M6US99_9LEPT|nr:hypothetical protein [Leptospira santarosai]EMO22320.1 hypothetical protein LEP1GSC168_2462 [Leptospira santarosai str. HAI134]EMO45631.1 hypothetical protein LEP1GSC187_3074 [Leptospira santarosai str. ZUN179]EMP80555.1 hypothetical protein LEP1GSC162_3592 [Leptospira santarosai str. CBC1531]MDI7212925.1 hypothetical protein [Leptospira santarosai]
MKTRKMTTENLREALSKATPSNPFQFFKHVNCIMTDPGSFER